jgi:hypothetical protein
MMPSKVVVDLDFKAGVSDAQERLRDVLSSNASDQRIRHQRRGEHFNP